MVVFFSFLSKPNICHKLQPRPPLTGVSRALRARNPERVSKESPKSLPGPSGPGVQKVSETVSKQSPESQNRLFRDSGDCFETVSDTFWTPGPEGPDRLFGDSFGIPGPEGPGDSCKGRPGLQAINIDYACSGWLSGWGSC